MKIAFLVDQFPSVSQTFVLNQIAGLLGLGHDVHVFASTSVGKVKIHEKYEQYGLLKKTRYYRIPKNKALRILKAMFFIVKYAPGNPKAIFRSLNVFRYGRQAASFSLLFMSIPLLERGPFDIIHAQFGTLGLYAVSLNQILPCKCKLVTSIRGYDVTMFLKKHPGIYRTLFKEGDLFLPVCEFLKERLIQDGCEGKKIVVHHSGID